MRSIRRSRLLPRRSTHQRRAQGHPLSNLQAVTAALAGRNKAKAAYDESQDELAELVHAAAQQDGGWYQMTKIGLRTPEIQRLIRRHEKNRTA